MYKTTDLFDLEKTRAKPLLEKSEYPWEALSGIGDLIKELGKTLPTDEFFSPLDDIYISRSASIADTASITAPCIICEGAQLRHGCFLRGNVIVGKNAVVGNSVELKNVILFDDVQVPHFNYVGDSILGYKAHMGAGSITSNVKGDRSLVEVKCGEKKLATGIKKVGAMLGDGAEIGCNCVLNPGSIIGKNSMVYPLCSVRGTVPENSIYKSESEIIQKK